MLDTHGLAPRGKRYVEHPPEVKARIARLCQFHDLTKLAPQAGDAGLPEQQPRVFQVFADAPKIALPTKLLDAPTGALKVMSQGIAALPESMTSPPQNLQTLASWLHFSAGITGKIAVGEQSHYLRAYPSAGALYPTELYVLALGISDLEPGLYHFSAKEFSLRKLREGWESLWQLKRGRPDLEVLKTMPAIVLVSSILWRSAWKYGNRAYRYATIDAGHVTENLVQCGAGLGIQTMVRMHLNDRNTRDLIGAAKDARFDCFEVVQGFVAWADTAHHPIEPPKIRSAPAPLPAIARPPVSTTCVEYPAIRAAHDDCVAPGVGINELRPPHTESCPLDQGRELVALANEDIFADMPIVQAIKRRRSVRTYEEHAISRDQFGKLNRLTFRGGTYHPLLPDGQHMGLIRAFWFVHGITGVTAGLWYYHANYDKFTPLRYGDFRFEAKYLCDNQEFCGAGSALCVMIADLRGSMNASSPDAYRLAHLEAGLAGQRLSLACSAMYIDCCPVGSFQDDELCAALDLASSHWQCIYAFALGTVRRPKQVEIAPPHESSAGDGGIHFK